MKFVNIYRDPEAGEHDRFISSIDYGTYDEAYSMRDDISTYVETVGIVRKEEMEAKPEPEFTTAINEASLELTKQKVVELTGASPVDPSPLYELAEIYSKPGTKYEPAPVESYWGPVVADQFPLDNQLIDLFDGCDTYPNCKYYDGAVFAPEGHKMDLWNGLALSGVEWRYAE